MRLDMYAYSAPANLIGDNQINVNAALFEEGKPKEDVNTNFAYWGEFYALHDWMHTLYCSKGGDGDFNCQQVRLMDEDLDALKAMAEGKKLKPVCGFFFGNDEYFTDEDKEEVLEFVKKAKAELSVDRAVIYDSWW